MAKLKAHGSEIGTVEYVGYRIRYMSDGKILISHGDGWKIYGSVKDTSTPQQAFENRKARMAEREKACPAYREYKQILYGNWSPSNHWRVITLLKSLPNDPDGIWGELDDLHCGADFDTIAQLCRAYRDSRQELIKFNKCLSTSQGT